MAIASGLLMLLVQGSRAQTLPVLQQGARIEHRSVAAQSDIYRIALIAGDYLHVTLAQRGRDLSVTVTAPDGRDLSTVDAISDAYRDEAAAMIAEVSGTYSLTVRPVRPVAPAGRYVIIVGDIRPATSEDRMRVEAERSFNQAASLQSGPRPSWSEAMSGAESALMTYRQLGDRRGELKALLVRAGSEYALVRPGLLTTVEEVERLARELGDEAGRAAALHVQALAHDRLGNRDRALALENESISISRALGNLRREAVSANTLGVLYDEIGDPERAALRYEQARALAREVGDDVVELVALNNLGIAYKRLGELQKSTAVLEQALARYRAANNLQAQATVLNNIGNTEHSLGRDQEALRRHLEALALSRQSHSRIDEARSLNTIGQTFYSLGEDAPAVKYSRDALAIRREIGDLQGQGVSLSNIGRAAQRLGDTDQALAALAEALAIQHRIREQIPRLDTLRDLAEVERDKGQPAAALRTIATAVDAEEVLREQITSPALRTSFAAVQYDKYQRFIDLLQEQHREAQAFATSERARARMLLESLLDARVDLRQGIDPALLDRERLLQTQLNDASAVLSRALSTNRPADQVNAAATKVDDLTRDYEQLQAAIRRDSPRYAAITQPRPLSAGEIQSTVLDADTVLLEFSLGEERSWLWAVTRSSISSIELPKRQAIDVRARRVYEAYTARTRRHDEDAAAYERRVADADARLQRDAAALSRVLLGGIARRLTGEWRGKRLAIVPTGSLEYLPFAALPVPASTRAAPLVAQHEVVILPSASVLAGLRIEDAPRRRNPARAVAVLADPVFERDDPRLSPSTAAAAATSRGSTLDAGAPARLPFSREEADGIRSLAGPGRVFEATDFKATREAVLGGALAGYRIVHFATHGMVDSERPALSGLVLSLVDERGKPRNGYLRLHDIYNLRLDADLVVLSACETALGKEIRGEGLVGLTRAFMYAGAPRVVASLWEVNDLATAELMKAFYRGMLERRMHPAAALRAAQLQLSRDPRWSSPYYWAGFVLQGDWN